MGSWSQEAFRALCAKDEGRLPMKTAATWRGDVSLFHELLLAPIEAAAPPPILDLSAPKARLQTPAPVSSVQSPGLLFPR